MLKSNVKRLTPTEVALIDKLRSTYQKETEEKVVYKNIVEQDDNLHLVLSDIHVPGHNKKLIEDILSIIDEYPLKSITIAGDFLDMYSIASFNSNSLGKLKEWTLSDEYKMGNELLDRFDEVKGDAEVIFLYGNHEERFEREIDKLDNAKYGTALLNVRDGLKLDERGYTVIEDYPDGVVSIGNEKNGIDIIHGQRVNKYPAAATLNDNGRNVMLCHTHRFSTFADHQGVGYNIGCLIDIENPLFGYMTRMQRKKWTNGFAFINEDKEGNTFVEPIKVTDNTFYFRGRKY